jgi:hypothetical protein
MVIYFVFRLFYYSLLGIFVFRENNTNKPAKFPKSAKTH